MIFYFTGTGNSKYVADFLAEALSDETVSLGEILKKDLSRSFSSEKPFVWVAPIYAWRYPKKIEELLKKVYLQGNRKIYFVATMGGDSGNYCEFCKKITEKRGMIYGGFADVVMPDNYFAGFSMKESEALNIIKKAEFTMEEIADKIKNDKYLDIREKTSFGGFKSLFINYGFNNFMIKNMKFKVNDDCNSCGLCEKLCPVNNIEITNGKPVFANKCMGCYSCIHHCKQKAINLGKNTEGKERYVCIDFKGETL